METLAAAVALWLIVWFDGTPVRCLADTAPAVPPVQVADLAAGALGALVEILAALVHPELAWPDEVLPTRAETRPVPLD